MAFTEKPAVVRLYPTHEDDEMYIDCTFRTDDEKKKLREMTVRQVIDYLMQNYEKCASSFEAHKDLSNLISSHPTFSVVINAKQFDVIIDADQKKIKEDQRNSPIICDDYWSVDKAGRSVCEIRLRKPPAGSGLESRIYL